MTNDHLGSPRIVTDGIRAVVSRHDYLTFGDEVTETVGNVAGRTSGQGYGGTDEIRKQYTGYERDKESGLDFAQARYYNSQQGRFTSVDPLTASASIRNPQTFNRYSYVLNSPYKFTDPLGLLAETTGACGSECPQSIGGGYNGGTVFDSLNGLGHKQQFAETPSPPPPNNDGTVDPSDIAKTVTYTSASFTASALGPPFVVLFSPELAEALTEIAQTAQGLHGAYLRNRDTALTESAEFINEVDRQNGLELTDLTDLYVDRNYGGVAPSGLVVLPSEVNSEAKSLSVGGSGGISLGIEGTSGAEGAVTTAVQIFANVAVASANKANTQLRELNKLRDSNSTQRGEFIKKFQGISLHVTRPDGTETAFTVSTSGLNQLYDNAIIRGKNGANRNHKQK